MELCERALQRVVMVKGAEMEAEPQRNRALGFRLRFLIEYLVSTHDP